MTTKTCLNCLASFEPNPKSKRIQKFCSKRCSFNYWKANHREHYKEIVTPKNIIYMKQRKERWKQEGKCLRCGRERAEGKTKCQKCLEYQRNYYLFRKNKKIKDENKESVTT